MKRLSSLTTTNGGLFKLYEPFHLQGSLVGGRKYKYRKRVDVCTSTLFSSADCADDADYPFLLYPIGYNLSASSASSADEELDGGIFDTASFYF